MIHNTLFKKSLIFLIVFLAVLVLPKISWAATINAASCSYSDVSSAIAASASGDTVLVPAGNCSWSSSVTIDNKTITVMGAGIDQTNITVSGGAGFTLSGNQSSRISGFTFTLLSWGPAFYITGGQNWRIDHCKIFNSATGIKDGIFGYGLPDNVFKGLVDNCQFVNVRLVYYGEPTDFPPPGKTRWSEPLNIGTENAIYIEDSIFTANSGTFVPAADTNQGGRYVFRFNQLNNQYVEFHSVQGNNRAGRLFEVYNNTMNMDAGYTHYKPFRLRGGTGVVWGNQLVGSWNHRDIAFDNVRSYGAVSPGGLCDGTSSWDGNQDATGWPCRDQIGRSTDAYLWTSEPYPSQESAPVYLWLNRDGSNIFPASVINNSDKHIKNNRDFYDELQSFNGTLGTGYGTLANRPATCTTGVAYWATDQGDWNKAPGGEQGVLYKCTAANTWTAYYTPYAYPHPLRAEAVPPPDTTPPSPPANVVVS